jgi:hypothetical protein
LYSNHSICIPSVHLGCGLRDSAYKFELIDVCVIAGLIIFYIVPFIPETPSSVYIYYHCMSLRTVNPVLRTCKSISNKVRDGTDETGLHCPQIRVQISRSKFTYTPAPYIRPISTTPSSKMSTPTPQAPQTPLVGSGTDYSSLVQGSTDPTDQSMVIRQVIPGMLTFSVPFVCPSSFLAFISSLMT